MEWMLYASAVIAALAFLLLVIYIAKTLVVLQETLRRLTEAIGHTDEQVRALSGEIQQLLHTANSVVHDVQKKVDALTGVVEAVGETGDAIRTMNRAIRQTASALLSATTAGTSKWKKILRWADGFRDGWEKWRKKQSTKEVVVNGKK
ncbi:hypothetical protein LR69_02107 [Geobacillus sp. BCO2]|nr:hypothetical protein LR69_02107 [Geobacillus sp. BCO2]